MRRADLHVHTAESDGFLPPDRVVALSRTAGLSALAIADHDTVAGVRALRARLTTQGSSHGCGDSFLLDGVEVIPAVEISTRYGDHELHILGYFVPVDEGSAFALFLENLRRSRTDRVRLIVSRLREIGMPVQIERVFRLAKGESVGRPHVAHAMVEAGYVSSVGEAFEKYLDAGRPAYVSRPHPTPVEAIRKIVAAGGVAVWAHPASSGCDEILTELVESGLAGLECFHPQHSPQDVLRYSSLAQGLGLIKTGGSDYHGPGSTEGGELGDCSVDYCVVQMLKERARS